jgi:hypothetical protein
MEDMNIVPIGPITVCVDGVIIPVTSFDFIRISRTFKMYKETGPVDAPTLHLEKSGISICIVAVPVRQ